MRRLTPAAVLPALLLAGCTTPGLLYTDVTWPLTLNMNETPRADGYASGGQNAFREPITRVRAEWSGYGLGKAARKGNIDAVHYADVRRQSILLGLFSRTTIELYGIKGPEDEASEPEGSPD